MEVDDIVGVPTWAEKRIIKSRATTEELASQEPKVFEEEFVTLHHTTYNRNKKLLIEKVKLRKKKVFEKWKSQIDFKGETP